MFDTGPHWIRFGQRILPDCCWQGDPARPAIALSYDDGPHPERTARVLDILEQHQIRATFFWLGDRLDASKAVIERIAQSQHAIALHGERHRSFFLQSPAGLVKHYDRLRMRIAQISGRDPESLKWLRPPWGHALPGQVKALRDAGYRVIMASLLPGDWSARPEVVTKRVLAQVRNGSLIALHDGGIAGRNSIALAELLIPTLASRGFEFVTVPELFAPK